MPKPQATKPASKSSRRRSAKPKAENSLMDRIVSVDDLDIAGLRIGIYGNTGTGKTRALASFSRMGRMLHLVSSAQGKNEAISSKGYKDIDVVDIRSPYELKEYVDLATESGKWASIALDHVTYYAETVLADLLDMDAVPEQSSWGMATQEEYGQMALRTKEYLRGLFNFPGNVFLLGQERTFETDKDYDEEFSIAPTVTIASTKSISTWIPPQCDYFIRTFKREERKTKTVKKKIGGKMKTTTKTEYTGKIEYCLQCGPDPVYLTKFRVPVGTTVPGVLVVGETEKDDAYAKLSPYFN